MDKTTKDLINFRHIIYKEVNIYSKNEIIKLEQFSNISNQVINDILNTINKDEYTKINIEGYSYSSNAGPILDLVGIGQSIRLKLFELIPNSDITIMSPKTIKTQACELVYGFYIKEKEKVKLKKLLIQTMVESQVVILLKLICVKHYWMEM